jgi:hypothetical protein
LPFVKSARGWRLQPSAMDWVVLHFVLKGEGCIEIAGERIPLAPNMIVVTPSHSVKHRGLGEVVRENGNAVWDALLPSCWLLATHAAAEPAWCVSYKAGSRHDAPD